MPLRSVVFQGSSNTQRSDRNPRRISSIFGTLKKAGGLWAEHAFVFLDCGCQAETYPLEDLRAEQIDFTEKKHSGNIVIVP